MAGNFKNIHIGKLIERRMQECEVARERAAAFLNVSEEEIEEMYTQKTVDSYILLRWSKLLQYDFFRIYSQHLILYAPQDINSVTRKKNIDSKLPVFKKNVYTQEVILYLVSLVEKGAKTFKELQNEYNIPSTTIFRWYDKYAKKDKVK